MGPKLTSVEFPKHFVSWTQATVGLVILGFTGWTSHSTVEMSHFI